MIPVPNPIREPAEFDRDCRLPGNAWLSANPSARPKSFPAHWIKFEADLEAAFACRCGWWAMRIQSGTVDHFLSKNQAANRHLVQDYAPLVAAAVEKWQRDHPGTPLP